MSRVNLDYLSTVLSFETTTASVASTGNDCATDTFDRLLQRARSEANSQTDDAHTARTAERDRESRSAAASPDRSQPSQDEQASAPKKQGGEGSAASETANDSTETEEAVSESGGPGEGDAGRDDSDTDDDAEDPLAVAVAAQIQPEPVAAPVDELLLSGDVAPLSATDGSAQSPSAAAPDASLASMLTDTLADPSTTPTEGQPAPEAQVTEDLVGAVGEMLPEQTASQLPSAPTAETVKPASEGDLPGEETKPADLSSDGQSASAETAAIQATATDDDSSRENRYSRGKTALNGGQTQGDSQTQASSEIVSSSLLPDETTDALEPDPTAELPDGKTDHAKASGETATTKTSEGQARPFVFDANANQSTTASQGTGEGDSTGGQADRMRFVQRVARAFESAAGDGGSVRLRLSPPELGSLRLEVTLRNGVMNAHVEAETPAARNLLLDNLPALRERLAEQNIKVEQFDVDLTDQGKNSSWQQPSDRQDSEPRRADDDSRPRGRQASTVENTTAARPAPRYGQGGGFDVTI